MCMSLDSFQMQTTNYLHSDTLFYVDPNVEV